MPPPSPQKKTQKVQLIIKLFSITLLYLTLPPMFYWCLPPYTLAVKSNSPYSLINRNFHAISTTPKNLKKKPKITIDNTFAFRYSPVPHVSITAPNEDYYQSSGSAVSYYTYSSRNHNQYFKIVS